MQTPEPTRAPSRGRRGSGWWVGWLLAPLLTGCAYFNTFYNATTYYETGVAALGAASGGAEAPLSKPAGDALAKAIEKSLKVIDTYPESRYVDDAFFILGRSHFHRREYGLAERYLGQLLAEYPWSPFSNETRVWLARVHAQLGLLEAVEADLAPILAMPNPPRALLTDIYVLRGEMAVRRGDLPAAMSAFERGAETAGDAALRAGIYHQLYTLAVEQEAYDRALEFLDRYARTVPSEKKRVAARLSRVQLMQKGGDLDRVYREIRNMVALSEFAGIVPGLVLELGKIELQQGDRDAAVEHFVEVAEEFPALPEAGEAAYRAGVIYLAEGHEIDVAKGYLKRVKRSSPYYQMAREKLDQLIALDRLTTDIEKLRLQLGMSGSPNPVDVRTREQPANERPFARMDEEAEAESTEAMEAEIDTAGVRQELAYALFRQAEIHLFDMNNPEPALGTMSEIVSTLGETSVAAQAAYVLFVTSRENQQQADFWQALLLEKYPDTPYSRLLSGAGTSVGTPLLDDLTARADEEVGRRPAKALGLFRRISKQFSTEHSSFAIAYLYDEYLAQLDSAIVAYDEYLTFYPDGSHQQLASDRLEFLRRVKEGSSAGGTAPVAAGPGDGADPAGNAVNEQREAPTSDQDGSDP